MENKYIFEPKMGSHKLEEIAFVLTNVLTENQKPLKINDLKGFFTWYLQESNQGHKDFQSFALPTELRYQLSVGANLTTFSFENQINFQKIVKSSLTLC